MREVNFIAIIVQNSPVGRGPYEEIVPKRVQSHGNNRSRAADELGDELLLDEVEGPDVVLAGHKENGLGGVEARRDYLAAFLVASKKSHPIIRHQGNRNNKREWDGSGSIESERVGRGYAEREGGRETRPWLPHSPLVLLKGVWVAHFEI